MSVKLRKDKSGKSKHYYYLDTHIKGLPRERTSLGLFTYARPKSQLERHHNEVTTIQAEEIRANKQLELQGMINGVEYIAPSKITFIAFFQDFITNYPKKDVNKFKSALFYFKKFTDSMPFKLDQAFVDRLSYYLKNDAGLDGETPYTYFTRIKRLLKEAYKKRIVKTNPAELTWSLKFDSHHMRKEVLDETDLAKLVNTPCGNENLKRMFLFCCNTGLRFGDGKNLTWGDISNFKLGIEQGKTGNFVYVPLNDNARKLVGKQGRSDDLVFPEVGSSTSARQVIMNWCKAAKVEKHITNHCSRHTFCTLLMKNKVDPKTIITLMGWSEDEGMKHLMRYSHLVDDSAKNAVDGLPKLF